jgi:large subunit ribosomal protein L4
MIRLALRSALSDRAQAGKVVVIDDWGWDRPSTRAGKAALTALGVEGKVLVVVGRDEPNAILSFRNLPEVQLLEVSELNAYDVLCNDWIVFSRATVPSGDGGATKEAVQPASATRRKAAAEPQSDEAPVEEAATDEVETPADEAPADEADVATDAEEEEQ